MSTFKNLLPLIMLASPAFAAKVVSGTGNIKGRNVPVSDQRIDITFGATDNPTLAKDGFTGSFFDINPHINTATNIGQNFLLGTSLTGNLRRFSKNHVDELANSKSFRPSIDTTWYLSDQWELGADLNYEYTDDIRSGQREVYTQPDAALHLGYYPEGWEYEGQLLASFRRYHNDAPYGFDNEEHFRKNNNEYSATGRVKLRPASDFWSIQLKSTLRLTRYTQKITYHSEGLPPFPGESLSNEKTRLLTHEHELRPEIELGVLKFQPSVALSYTTDQGFGAFSSTGGRASTHVEIQLPLNVSLKPGLIYLWEHFKNFRADPVNNPINGPLKEDSTRVITLDILLQIQANIGISAQFGQQSRKSNSDLETSYIENWVQSGLSFYF